MFHRLTAPSYIGGLPVGYDYLNNPSGPPVIGGGVPAPVDPLKSSGPNEGVYFVAFGEDGRAGAANRGLAALALNTDVIDDFLHSDTAITASVDLVGPAIIVGTAANPVYRGPTGTPNTQVGLEPYFHVTDLSNNDIVDVATNTQSVVTSITVNPGVGFFVGSITLAVSPAPAGTYRIWYGTRSSLAEMTKGEFVRQNVWGVQRKQAGFIQFTNNLISTAVAKGAELVGINTAGFTAALVEPSGAAGGLGTAFTTVKGALLAADTAVRRRRAYTAVLTDGVATFGGDYSSNIVDTVFNTYAAGGSFFARKGVYYITDTAPGTYSGSISFQGDATIAALILDATRSSDFVIDGILDTQNVYLSSNSAMLKSFKVSPMFEGNGLRLVRSQFQGGNLYVAGATQGGFVELEDVFLSPGTNSRSYGAFDVSGEQRLNIKRGNFNAVDGSPNKFNVYLHDTTNTNYSSVLVEDSYFLSSTNDVNALDLENVRVPTVFRNCMFEVTSIATVAYKAYAVKIQNCSNIVFENCVFKSKSGHAFAGLAASVALRDCRFLTTNTVPNTAKSEMFVLYSKQFEHCTIDNCTIEVGTSSIRGVGATIDKAIVSLNGLTAAANTLTSIAVRKLHIKYGTAITPAHNFSTVVMHGGASGGKACYDDVTFDGNGTSSDGTGTLAGVYVDSIGGGPAFVEIGGGSARADTTVDNLTVFNFRNPSANHQRQCLYMDYCVASKVTIDATSDVTSGSFTSTPVELIRSDVSVLNIGRSNGLKAIVTHFSAVNSSRIRGGEFWGHTSVVPGAWVATGGTSSIESFIVFLASTVTMVGTAPVVSLNGAADALLDSAIVADGAYSGFMVNSTDAEARIHNNLIRWSRNAAVNILVASGNHASVTGNIIGTTAATAPTKSVSGTGSIDDGNSLLSGLTAVSYL